MQMTNPAIQNDFSYYRRTISRNRLNNQQVRPWRRDLAPAVYVAWLRFLSLIIQDCSSGRVLFLLTTQRDLQTILHKPKPGLKLGAVRRLMLFKDTRSVLCWHTAGGGERGQQWDGQSDVSVLRRSNANAEDSEQRHHQVCVRGRFSNFTPSQIHI